MISTFFAQLSLDLFNVLNPIPGIGNALWTLINFFLSIPEALFNAFGL